jgi:iron complex transport system substrate-binding protein
VKACLAALIPIVLSCLCACTEAPQPANDVSTHSRLVTLAPNLTELVYAAGAGDSLVGVSAYSDYPPAATDLPIIGDAFMIDQEQLAVLQPDLLLVWESGTPAHVVDELRRVGYKVETVRTRGLEDVARALRRIGKLTGHVETAEQVADAYMQSLRSIQAQYAGMDTVRVFYQVSRRPLFTVNGEHYVSELIDLCGGTNIFADLNDLAPTIDVEAVVERDPELMLASSDAGDNAFEEWQRWPHIAANRNRNHFIMPADAIGRATPRLVVAAQAMCEAIQKARMNSVSTRAPDSRALLRRFPLSPERVQSQTAGQTDG